jgi:hypothetical protein
MPRVRVIEQNSAAATFGFGVVFSDAALEFAFGYLTRSGRVDLERLRGISPQFIATYEQYLTAGTNR